MNRILIQGGRVIDPASGVDNVCDVLIENGRIAAIGRDLEQPDQTIDATGLIVAPGFIDLHAHGQSIPADRMQAFDGVTTTLDLESGVTSVYGVGSTVLAAAFFSEENFEARHGVGYDSVQRMSDGHRFTSREELLQAQSKEPSSLVLWHLLDIENNTHHRRLLDMAVLYPGGAIASDAMPWTLPDGSTYTGDAWPLPEGAVAHPRSSGCFTRFIREWVRERKSLPLIEAIRKCSTIPAQIMSESTPALRTKGKLQVGADADVVIFDLETLTDRADFLSMNRPAEGVRHLIVSGQALIKDGTLDVSARPGKSVRRAQEIN